MPQTLTASTYVEETQVAGSAAMADRPESREWHASRRPRDETEDALRDRAFKWLATLPVEVRPMTTGHRYPRIVNRICDLWGHCEYTRLFFQSLLFDRRKGRRGFPPEVSDELTVLQQYYFEHLSGLPAILWNAVPVRVSKVPNEVFPCPAPPAEIEILPL